MPQKTAIFHPILCFQIDYLFQPRTEINICLKIRQLRAQNKLLFKLLQANKLFEKLKRLVENIQIKYCFIIKLILLFRVFLKEISKTIRPLFLLQRE